MNKPNPKPLNPDSPRSKKANVTPLPRIYPENMTDDTYALDEVNKILNEIYHEDNNKNNS
ncbi:hypothetical protein EBS40_02830 [bacterium]|nr:hypothetical protein [bacterium]